MGANQSELTNNISKIPSLEKKPDLLKQELRAFVTAVGLDVPLPVKVDSKVAKIMLALLKTELEAKNVDDVLLVLGSFQRLLKTRGFYTSLPKNAIHPLIDSLKSANEKIVLAGLDAIAWTLACRVNPEPSQENKFRRSEAEEAMKIAFFETRGYEVIIALFSKHVKALQALLASNTSGPSASNNSNVAINPCIPKILDILSMDLVDRASTSRFVIVQRIISLLSPYLDSILELTLSSDLNTRGFSSILLQGYLMHAPMNVAKAFQDRVLQSGYLLWYIYFAIDGADIPNDHIYKQRWYDPNQTDLSRNLLGLLTAGHDWNTAIVKRAVPEPLWVALNQPIAKHRSAAGAPKKDDKKVLEQTLWSHLASGKITRLNWHPVFEAMDVEQNAPALIWNVRAKSELLAALTAEIDHIAISKTIKEDYIWNYEGFDIVYPSLKRYFKVGKYYISRFLFALSDPNTKITMSLEAVTQLAFELFQRAPVEDDPGWKLACIRALRLIYDRFPTALRGLQLIPFFTWLLSPKNTHPLWRDHCLHFLLLLLQFPENCKSFVHFGGIPHLLHWIAQIHTVENAAEDSLNYSSFLETFLSTLLSQEEFAAKQQEIEQKNLAASNTPSVDANDKKNNDKKKNEKDEANDDETEEERQAKLEQSKQEEEQARAENRKKPQNIGGIVLSDKANDHTAAELAAQNSDEFEDLLKDLPPALSIPEVADRCLAALILVSRAGPRMKKKVSNHDTISTLTRLLLTPYTALRTVSIQLLLELIDDSLFLAPQLAGEGLWTFLVYSLRFGCPPQLGQLVARFHHKQLPKYSEGQPSILFPFFPGPLIRALQLKGADTFVALLDKDTIHPELLWNTDLRVYLNDQVAALLQPFLLSLKQNPFTPYDFKPVKPLPYPALESELCIGYSYIRILNQIGLAAEKSSTLNTDLVVSDPNLLISELSKALASRRYTGNDLNSVLQATSLLIKRYPTEKESLEFNVEPLMDLLAAPTKSSADESNLAFTRVEKTAELLHHLFVLESNTVQATFDCRGLDAMVDSLTALLGMDNGQPALRKQIVPPIYHLLNAVSVMAGKHSGSLRHMEHSKTLLKQVVALLSSDWALNFPTSTMAACKCLFTFTQQSERMQTLVLESGALLNLIKLALFYEASSNRQDEQVSEDSDSSGAQDKSSMADVASETDWTNKIRRAAAYVLSAARGQANTGTRLVKLLELILSPALFKALENPTEFIARAHMYDNSTIAAIREQVSLYIDAQLNDVRKNGGKWNGWQPENFKFELRLPISE